MSASPAAEKQRSRRSRWLTVLRLAFPLVAAAALVTALQDHDRGRAFAVVAGHLAWLPLVLLPFMVGMACDAASMWLMLGTVHKVPYRAVLRLRFAAEGALFTLPAGSIAAEALKPVLLRRSCGVPVAVGATVVLLNKAFIVLTNAVYLVLGLALGGALLRAALPPRWGTLLTVVTVGGTLGCLTLGVILLLAVRRADLLMRLARRLPARWGRRLADLPPATLAHTAVFFRSRLRLAACCGLTLLHWLTEAFETYAAAHLLGLPLTPSGALAFESVLALSRSLAFFLPGGLGVQDGGHLLLVRLAGAADITLVGGMLVIVKRAKELLWTTAAALLMPRRSTPGTEAS